MESDLAPAQLPHLFRCLLHGKHQTFDSLSKAACRTAPRSCAVALLPRDFRDECLLQLISLVLTKAAIKVWAACSLCMSHRARRRRLAVGGIAGFTASVLVATSSTSSLTSCPTMVAASCISSFSSWSLSVALEKSSMDSPSPTSSLASCLTSCPASLPPSGGHE